MTSARATATRCCSPADQLVGPVVLLAGEIDEGDDVADPLCKLALAGVLAGDRERQGDVLGDVEERDQVERLEDEAGPVAPERGRRRRPTAG